MRPYAWGPNPIGLESLSGEEETPGMHVCRGKATRTWWEGGRPQAKEGGLGGNQTRPHLVSGLSASRILRNIFLLVKPSVCHGGLSLLILIVFNSLYITSFADVSKESMWFHLCFLYFYWVQMMNSMCSYCISFYPIIFIFYLLKNFFK